ncbi:MAG: TorD/DmsD family molecular chaperone [Coriobacteriales bacterium]
MERAMQTVPMKGGIASADFARYRSALYVVASRVFASEATVKLLDSFKEAEHCFEPGAALRPSEARLMKDLAESLKGDSQTLRGLLATEYAELFLGPRPPLAPLFESVYVGFPNRLYTDVTMAVRRCYQQQGWKRTDSAHVPDDSIAFELEFMAHLSSREAALLDSGKRVAAYELRASEQSFLDEHLCQWAWMFEERVAKAPGIGFYQAWSAFVTAFAQEDSTFLAQTLQSSGSFRETLDMQLSDDGEVHQ